MTLIDCDTPKVAVMFLKKMASASCVVVESVVTEPYTRPRPQPMNTVEMLKQASKFLGIGTFARGSTMLGRSVGRSV